MSYDNLYYGAQSQWRIQAEKLYSGCNIFTPHASQKFPLNAIAESRDGRKFRYCKNGATEIAKALMTACEAVDAQQVAKIQTAYGAAAGDKKFDAIFTTGSGIVDHELIDGYLLVNDGGTAMGDMYLIKDNYWVTSDTVMMFEIADEGGLRNAVLVTDDLTMVKNKCRDVIVKPTTLTGPVVGVTLTIVPANYYFWAQYKGWAPMIVDNGDTIVTGEPVGHIDGSATAGSVGLVATHATDTVFGACVYPSTADEVAIIDLNLPD